MFKKLLCLVSLIYVCSMDAYSSDKLAVVNISNVFQQSTQRAIVAKQLEDEFRDRANELQSMERDLQNKMKSLQNDGLHMNANERNLLEKSVLDQHEIFSNKAKVFQQDNQSRQTEERNKILNIIQDVITKIAKKEGYDLVFDSSAVAYIGNIKDITNDVLKQVN